MGIDTVAIATSKPASRWRLSCLRCRGRWSGSRPSNADVCHERSDFTLRTVDRGPPPDGRDKTGDYVWVCDWWAGILLDRYPHTESDDRAASQTDALQPYQAAVDSNTCLDQYHGGDEVMKYDVKTSQWTEYSPSDARRGDSLFFDPRHTARCNDRAVFKDEKVLEMTFRTRKTCRR